VPGTCFLCLKVPGTLRAENAKAQKVSHESLTKGYLCDIIIMINIIFITKTAFYRLVFTVPSPQPMIEITGRQKKCVQTH
jgi:hypothetical protein